MDLLGGYLNRDEELLRFHRLSSVAAVKRRPIKAPKRARRLAEPDVQQLIEAYRQGTSLHDLCQTWKVNRDTVYDHLERAGVKRDRKNKLSAEDTATATALYASGLGLDAIGRRLGVAGKTVRGALLRAGVDIRPRNGWPVKN